MAAGGIANIIAGLSSRTWYFQAGTGGGVEGIKSISGTWNSSGATGISWGGDDPSFTASESETVSRLFVSEANSVLDDDIICDISHSSVSLSDGDTIIYTSIEINFTT